MLFARYNPAVCAVAPHAAYLQFILSCKLPLERNPVVRIVWINELSQVTAHVHECRGGRGS